MMVRTFLHRCHRGYPLLAAWMLVMPTLVFAPPSRAGIENQQTDMRSQIAAFMDNYTRDLVQRLGTGARVEYDSAAIAVNAETRSCNQPLNINTNNQQSLGRITLLIACANEWSAYMPIDLNIYRPVVVATKPLANGAVIGADDVELNALEISQLVGTYITTLEETIGMGVKRPITPGKAILVQQLEQPMLIRRGEAVIINAKSGELAVKMTGTAMTDGRRGELIRIKNRTSSRIVDGRVIASGQVTVAM